MWHFVKNWFVATWEELGYVVPPHSKVLIKNLSKDNPHWIKLRTRTLAVEPDRFVVLVMPREKNVVSFPYAIHTCAISKDLTSYEKLQIDRDSPYYFRVR